MVAADSVLPLGLAEELLARASSLLAPNALATGAVALLVLLFLLYKRSRLDLDKIPGPTFTEVLALVKDVPRANEWFRRNHEKYGM